MSLNTESLPPALSAARHARGHLRVLESEAIHILREVAGQFERPVILFSGGKDSILVLYLARRAFHPAPIPFSLLHVDTGHNFPEVIAYRDAVVAEGDFRLNVAHVQDWIDDGRLSERPNATRNPLQTVPLVDTIADERHDAVIGGARRDEERSRAKERIFSLRDAFGGWDPMAPPWDPMAPPWRPAWSVIAGLRCVTRPQAMPKTDVGPEQSISPGSASAHGRQPYRPAASRPLVRNDQSERYCHASSFRA
jgi:3'-phosphoadenosine 5'-phosphosulfate sulfotransferase (PAPS reductase)/FAD synthetase